MKKDWVVFSKQGKGIGYGLLGSATLIILATLLHAQTATVSPPPDSIVQVTAEAQGLELVAPADLPEDGTFWLATTNGIMAPSPCPPRNLQDFPVFQMADGIFLVDETGGQVETNEDNGTVESALAAEADAVVKLINQVQDTQDSQLNSDLAAAFGFDDGMDMMMADSSQMMATYDLNGLWLEITNVADGWSYFNMHNGTNFVYAVLSTTNLSDGTWNIETELFPTLDQTNVMPFAVQNFDRQILFVKAMDWTGVDSDNDGVPDWWAWQYWGSINVTDTNLDYSGNGNMFTQDYSNNIVPTVFSFTGIAVANNYVNSMSAPVQLAVAGSPYYIALSLDDTNYAADAVWKPYTSSNVTVPLGLTEGWHDGWIGLRGRADATNAAVWWYKRLKLELTPPVLVITSQTNGTVTQPMIQLTGYSPEVLSSISYDLSNATGLVTGQQVLILDQTYSTNTREFTTNTFQAFDVVLTNGVNTLTIHAADLAGNVTTTSFSLNFDFSGVTSPPNVQILWPPAGAQIAGNSFTLRGQVDDPTATVTASVTDTNGVTTTFAALMERNGNFWLENLPLNAGNTFMLSAMNAAGFATSLSLTNQPAPVALTLNAVSDPSQLWQATVSVGGTVSDGTCSVTVNGQAAAVSGNSWRADNVPVPAGGVAIFDVVAYTPGSTNAMPQQINQDKPPRLYADSYTDTESNEEIDQYQNYDDSGNPLPGITEDDSTDNYTLNWSDGSIGTAVDICNNPVFDSTTYWPTGSWPNIPAGTNISLTDGIEYVGSPVILEQCDTGVPLVDLTGSYLFPWPGNYRETVTETAARHAHVKMKLATGGKPGTGRLNLYCIHCTATQIIGVKDPVGTIGNFVQNVPVPAQDISLNGQALGSDGNLWLLLPDGTNLDVTPLVNNVDYYTFTEPNPPKYHPYIWLITSTTNANLDTATPEVCVGQKATFTLNGLPMGSISNMVGNWQLPTKYVNAKLQYVIGVTSPNYYVYDWLLQNTNQTSCWFVNGSGGHVMVDLNLLFNNGQYASVAANGNIAVYRPAFSDFSTTNSSGGFTNSPRTFLWDGTTNSYGNAVTGEHGQFWSVNVDSKYNGAIGILQLVNAVYTRNYGELSSYNTLNTGGDLWLDGSPTAGYQDPNNYQEGSYYTNFVFTHTIALSDQPAETIFALYLGDNVRLWGHFNDYLRFQPSGSGSIAVTLATNTWSMEGMATTANGIITNSTPVPSALSDCDAFPSWTLIKSGK